MGKKNRENIGKALKKEGGEDKIKLGLERDMKVVRMERERGGDKNKTKKL